MRGRALALWPFAERRGGLLGGVDVKRSRVP